MKSAFKLQEFVAHTSNVNCLQVGRKSAGVLVTGGEDKKVNVWAIGKSTAVLSLAGHQTPVECVAFDTAEEAVVAGAAGGIVKLWDLEQAKVTRTLTGHRLTCTSIDFHPFGDYFASGSMDTTLKVWDIRRKACINTYKGHARGVIKTCFSPDGRLVASASTDGEVKVWDLTAGKLLHDFQHDDAVTGIIYHPSELLLATCSTDRSVKWWDLETSQLADSTGPQATGVRTIAFAPDGCCLLAAAQDGLTAWAWEPVGQIDTVEVPWAKIQDMSLNQQDNKLIACSCNNSFVGVWVVDLSKLAPFSRQSGPSLAAGTIRADVVLQKPVPLSPALIRATKAPAMSQSPESMTSVSQDHALTAAQTPPMSPDLQQAAVQTNEEEGELQSESDLKLPRPGTASQQAGIDLRLTPLQEAIHAEATTSSSSQSLQNPDISATTPAGISRKAAADTSSGVTGLNLDLFMPPNLTPRQGVLLDAAETDFLAEVLSKHGGVLSILSSRQASLQIVGSFWQRGDVRGALNAIVQSADPSVAADVLSTLLSGQHCFKLEHCQTLTQCLELLIFASHENHIRTGIDIALTLLRTFGDVIRQTCQQTLDRMGVDVSFEERKARCDSITKGFQQLCDPVQQLLQRPGPLHASAARLHQQLLAL